MRLALFQPDIPQNTGTILRMAACFGVPCDIIAPVGFDASDRALRRAGLDYLDHAIIARHQSFADFDAARRSGNQRLILLTTSAHMPYYRFAFEDRDILLFGSESSGAPSHVHEAADARLVIPIAPQLRSINVALAAAMVLGEALRQTGRFPQGDRYADGRQK